MSFVWKRPWLTVPAASIAGMLIAWSFAIHAPAQEAARYWRFYKIDVEDDHQKTEGLVPETHPDGSMTRTIIPGKGRNSEGAVWRAWPKEGRASYVHPEKDGWLEVDWTVPPPTMARDQDITLGISVVARGNVYGGGHWWDVPRDSVIFKPEIVGGIGGWAKVQAGMVGDKFVPSASGSQVVQLKVGRLPSLKDQIFAVYLLDGDYGWQIHYHYEPVDKEPPPPPPPSKCEYTFAKEWNTNWGKLIIRLDGAKASGSYTNRDGQFGPGTFSGTVTGHVLDAEWKDDKGEGTLTLFLRSDGCGFSGQHTVKATPSPPTPPLPIPGPQGSDGKHPGNPIGPVGPGGLPGDPGSDPTAQRCIDEWIKLAMSIRNRLDKSDPKPGGPWRVSEYGQLLGHSVIAGLPPDGWDAKYRRNRYIVIWETWQQAHTLPAYGGELPPLADYVKDCHAKHKPTTPQPPPPTNRMTLLAEHRTVVAGETVLVPVWLYNATDVANVNFTVAYNAGIAKTEGGPSKGNLLGDALLSANPKEAGLIRLGFAQSKGLSGNGTVAYLPFRAVGKPGERTTLHLEVSIINNPGGTVLPIDKVDGSITIVGPGGELPGDCDGDGQLTALDAKCALDMSVQLIPEKKALDLDGDGSVTSRDATIILQRRAIALARGQQ